MDGNYMLGCGIVGRKTADPEAGWELVGALESSDPRLRLLAHSFLVENGEDSMDLLEDAIARGIIGPQVAGLCMAEILRRGLPSERGGQTIEPHLVDVSLC